jgi:hypothetical protein
MLHFVVLLVVLSVSVPAIFGHYRSPADKAQMELPLGLAASEGASSASRGPSSLNRFRKHWKLTSSRRSRPFPVATHFKKTSAWPKPSGTYEMKITHCGVRDGAGSSLRVVELVRRVGGRRRRRPSQTSEGGGELDQLYVSSCRNRHSFKNTVACELAGWNWNWNEGWSLARALRVFEAQAAQAARVQPSTNSPVPAPWQRELRRC